MRGQQYAKGENVIGAIEARVSRFGAIRNDTDDYTRFVLPRGQRSDYRYEIYVYSDGEPQIIARPAVLAEASPERPAFWSLPFERASFRSTDEQYWSFLRTLDVIVQHRTRIIQRKHLLVYTFRCEYQEDGHWIHLATISRSRFGQVWFLEAQEREKVFAAEPLAGAIWTHS